MEFWARTTPRRGRAPRPDPGNRPPGGGPAGAHQELGSLRAARDRAEREFLLSSLRDSRGNVTAAARRSSLSRESFYRLLKKHGIR